MQRTARYEMIRGERVFKSFDRLHIDPMTTIKRAIESVDRTDLDRIEAALANESISHEEYERLCREFEIALRLWKIRCAQYANENPVHFEPRLNEVTF